MSLYPVWSLIPSSRHRRKTTHKRTARPTTPHTAAQSSHRRPVRIRSRSTNERSSHAAPQWNSTRARSSTWAWGSPNSSQRPPLRRCRRRDHGNRGVRTGWWGCVRRNRVRNGSQPRCPRVLTPAVRLLRRRRTRCRVLGDGAGRRAKRQRQPVRLPVPGLWRVHQHHAERRCSRVLWHAHDGRSLGRGRRRNNHGDIRGAHSKFVEDVEHVTFSADHALETDQSVVYVTERAVFELTPDGLTLTEVAPGIDPGAVIAQLGFDPLLRTHWA